MFPGEPPGYRPLGLKSCRFWTTLVDSNLAGNRCTGHPADHRSTSTLGRTRMCHPTYNYPQWRNLLLLRDTTTEHTILRPTYSRMQPHNQWYNNHSKNVYVRRDQHISIIRLVKKYFISVLYIVNKRQVFYMKLDKTYIINQIQ